MKISFSPEEVKKQFRAAMIDMNASPDDNYDLIADGKINRYHIAGDKISSKNGAYVLHFDDGYPAGFIQDWKGEKRNWKFNANNSSLTQEERNYFNSPEYQNQLAEKQRQRNEELKRSQKEAAEKAEEEFYRCKDVGSPTITTTYLMKKDVKNHGVRFIYKNRECEGIAIPLYNINGKFQSLQFIYNDGSKKFYPKTSISGAFFPIYQKNSKPSNNELILLVEGFATGAKVHELTGLPTLCAMTCDNMSNVAKALKSSPKYKDSQIIVMADNDIQTEKNTMKTNKVSFNPGINAAKKLVEAGLAIGYAAPKFNYETPEGSDWDDYALIHGDYEATEVMKEEIRNILETAKNKMTTENQAQNSESVATLQNVTNVTEHNAHEQNQESKPYSSFSFADCCRQPHPINYLIKNIIQEQAQHMIFGQSEHGKGFVIVDMAASIACPEIETWNGHKLKHGHVIYFAGEGSQGLRKRFAGWAIKRGINPESVQLTVIDETFKLDSTDSEHTIDKTIAEIRKYSDKPVLVIFDTFNCYMGGEENSAKDAGIFVGLENQIKQTFKCAIMTIHHSGKSEKNESRGSSAIRAAMDIEFKVAKDGNVITLTQTKNKDNEKEKALKFNLEQMTIPEWFDEDGEPVTTCTIELNEAETRAIAKIQPKEEKPKMKKSEINAMKNYKKAAEEYGEIFHDKELNQDFIAVENDQWRKSSFANSHHEAKDSTNLRKEFSDVKKKLFTEMEILHKRIFGGKEFYCLHIKNNSNGNDDIATYAATLKEAILKRMENEGERTREITFD